MLGNCVADYQDVNAKFFDADKYWVIEVDQRGTGNSIPCVRDADMEVSAQNMARYMDIHLPMMSSDFEKVI